MRMRHWEEELVLLPLLVPLELLLSKIRMSRREDGDELVLVLVLVLVRGPLVLVRSNVWTTMRMRRVEVEEERMLVLVRALVQSKVSPTMRQERREECLA